MGRDLAGGDKDGESGVGWGKIGHTVTVPDTCPYPGTMMVHYNKY